MKIGFVTPWFADDIPGGSEAAIYGIVSNLKAAGIDVEILATCVEKFLSDWNVDFYPPGDDIAAGTVIRRFPVRKRDTGVFDKINYKLMNNISVSYEEERIFLKEMVNSPALYEYIDKQQESYSLFVFTPYMFGTTYYGCRLCPERSVVLPALHDESYAYMEHFKEVFPKVRGMLFNSEAERRLGERLYDLADVDVSVIGNGTKTDVSGNPDDFKTKYGIDDPFILYAGRKDEGKNVHTLIRYFAAYKKQFSGRLKLVLIGGGNLSVPDYVEDNIKDDIIDLGFIPIQDKYDACSASLFLCQPSLNESFSLVVMESWLCSRPVLVHADCEVTRDFAKKAQGGLFFSDYREFAGCVDYFISHKEQGDIMAENGRKYVIDNYRWEIITKKYIDYFERLCV